MFQPFQVIFRSSSGIVLNLTYKVEIVDMFVCMLAYSSRKDKLICTKLGKHFLEPGKKNIRVRTPESVMSSIPGEGGSCNSETKHDRRTAPRPKLFVSKRRSQELRSLTQKLSWVPVSVTMLG
jgi:hypothetical protein